MICNPLLESDFYKQVHWNQYPKDVAKVVSYFTPRMSRLMDMKATDDQDKLVMFGLQSYLKELIEDFDIYFFKRDKQEVLDEVKHILNNTFVRNI